MPLPALPNWMATADPLHQAVMLLSPIQTALLEKRRSFLHLAVEPQPHGITSLTLPQGTRLRVDYAAGVLIIEHPSGTEATSLDLSRHTQASLFEAVLIVLQADEFASLLADVPADELVTAFAERLAARAMRPVKLDLKAMTRSEPLTFDRDTAAGYAQAQDTVFTGLARFRARLEGHMTPIVLWPHHFDLSTLWMLDPEMDDHKPHLNFGFAPFTPGQFDQPYLYAYAYPYPDGFVPPAVPAPLRWQRDGWTGLVVTYDDLAETDVTVEDLYRQMFNVLRPLIERS